MQDTVATLYRQHSRRVFSTLVRLLGSFELAEEARIALTLREVCAPYEVPGPAERPARLTSVLRVVYLVFNEGHAAHAAALADEAIRLARLLQQLLPEPVCADYAERLAASDAKDLNEAIQIAAGIPPAQHGSIAVRPVRERPLHMPGSAQGAGGSGDHAQPAAS